MSPIEFRLPDVGEGIAAADIVEWRVAAGDHVREGQDLVEVQTDKAMVVIPCPVTGVVTRLGPPAGESLDVGSVLAIFETLEPAESPGGSRAETPPIGGGNSVVPDTAEIAASRGGPAAPGRRLAAPGSAGGRPLAAPSTRRLARELGVDLDAVAGSGPNGRILREDIHNASGASGPRSATAATPPVGASGAPPVGASATPPVGASGAPSAAVAPPAPMAPRPGQIVPLRGVRRAIARTLTRAWQEIPHVIDYREVDATQLLEARRLLKQRAQDRGDDALAHALTPTPLIAKVAATAVGDHPFVNASIDLEREEITLHEQINLGIATATPEGLIVPVLHGANHKSVAEIALEVAELARAARERRLRPDQLAGATFTVNNYGGLGIWLGTPIIRPPEVANLGVGAVRDRVVAVDGAPAVRPILVLAVAGDHRVLDGHTLAAFVNQVVGLLEEPLLLLEDLH